MTQTFSLLGFVAHLATVERDMHELGPAIVARACEMVCEEAKRVIGEGYDYWPALQPATEDDEHAASRNRRTSRQHRMAGARPRGRRRIEQRQGGVARARHLAHSAAFVPDGRRDAYGAEDLQ